MSDRIIDGGATGRQQLLHLLRDVCNAASVLCDKTVINSGQWAERAQPAIKACAILQRGLVNSHPAMSDELHMLGTEIQIALAAQSDETLFPARVQRIRDAIHRLRWRARDFERTPVLRPGRYLRDALTGIYYVDGICVLPLSAADKTMLELQP